MNVEYPVSDQAPPACRDERAFGLASVCRNALPVPLLTLTLSAALLTCEELALVGGRALEAASLAALAA